MPPQLPECDEVFKEFFDRWYSEDDRQRRRYTGTRPDAETWGRPGSSVETLCELTDAGQREVAAQIDKMLESTAGDWPAFLNVSGDIDIAWVDEFDKHFDAAAVHALMNRSEPSEFSNEFLVLACEFGATLGHTLLSLAEGTAWLFDWPYWESAVYDPASGYRINVFHWAIKKFSDYGIEDGYRAKLLKCVELVREGWSE
jgi:hypothetical protein